jgi:bifunctional non-homologous end joining protein LigD
MDHGSGAAGTRVEMAGDRLAEYQGRRDFGHTPEPAGRSHPAPSDGRFVVQEHHARRLHWDFRLERDGVLVAWALPNGFPEGPDEDLVAARRLAHPPDGSGGSGA